MGKQNILIRGHVPEECNFHATLSLTAKHNSVLRNHLEKAGPTTKYASLEIQNEILDIAASQILNAVVADCKRAQCYVFIADESTDVGMKEQISLCARFVDKKEDGKHYVREGFLTFVHAETGTTAEALTTQFLDALNKISLPVEMMRAQGYDGASVMSRHVNGVQTRVRHNSQNQPKGGLHPLSCSCVKSLHCPRLQTSSCWKRNGHNAGSVLGSWETTLL